VEHSYLAALAHVLQDGRVLLPMSRRRCVWKTVGGRTERGETPEQTMLREVEEEIGIRPTAYRRLPDRSVDAYDYPARIALFVITAWEGEPVNVAADEHSQIRWFEASEIPALPLQAVVKQEVLSLLSETERV
jgi:8-oxo-dGTP pyrophosphatase MutT (NUDIX family)